MLGLNHLAAAAAAAKLLQSCPTLCDPIDGSPPGSPVPGILQARTLEWVAISLSNAWKWKVKVKSCLTLSDPMDCSPPGSSVHGIFQARVLEWGAIAFSIKPSYCSIIHPFVRMIRMRWCRLNFGGGNVKRFCLEKQLRTVLLWCVFGTMPKNWEVT